MLQKITTHEQGGAVDSILKPEGILLHLAITRLLGLARNFDRRVLSIVCSLQHKHGVASATQPVCIELRAQVPQISCFRTKRALLAGKEVTDHGAVLRLVADQHFLAAAKKLDVDTGWRRGEGL